MPACRREARATAAAPSRTALVRRARKINRILAETYPDAASELDFDSPWQLLVVTVLSAQTTDKRVNAVSPRLFARYPGRRSSQRPTGQDVEQIIESTGFFRAKTQSIIKLAAAVLERFDGEVPARLDDLVTLPGVGPQDGERRARQRLRQSLASRSTPTSAGCPGASAGPPRPIPSRSSTRSARSSPNATGRCSATT